MLKALIFLHLGNTEGYTWLLQSILKNSASFWGYENWNFLTPGIVVRAINRGLNIKSYTDKVSDGYYNSSLQYIWNKYKEKVYKQVNLFPRAFLEAITNRVATLKDFVFICRIFHEICYFQQNFSLNVSYQRAAYRSLIKICTANIIIDHILYS